MAVNKNHFHFYFYPLNTSPAFVFNNNEYLCHLNLVTSQCIHTRTHMPSIRLSTESNRIFIEQRDLDKPSLSFFLVVYDTLNKTIDLKWIFFSLVHNHVIFTFSLLKIHPFFLFPL